MSAVKVKPHRGRIANWRKVEYTKGDFVIVGNFLDHPTLGKHGGMSQTSRVRKHDEKTGEIETRNSRYTLVAHEEG